MRVTPASSVKIGGPFDVNPCPGPGGTVIHTFDIFIPRDAKNPTHVYVDPASGQPVGLPLCPSATETDQVTIIDPAPGIPDKKAYRVVRTIMNGGIGPVPLVSIKVTWQ